ncbi:unnamed protein product [Notodromas monacha]|uniref:Ig-like domain-containing protein n=1 Tax=Notodromas monacha TaxID=399045 RepID=A0A7R9GHA5_9CRUS|nr:unnamed protein product [Notodromas monacha]CAG0922581.1 unnamed protein product [Notodromas monacha]
MDAKVWLAAWILACCVTGSPEGSSNSSTDLSRFSSAAAPATPQPCPAGCKCLLHQGVVDCSKAALTSGRTLGPLLGTGIILDLSKNFLVDFDCDELTNSDIVHLILDENRINHFFCQEKMPVLVKLSLKGNRLQHFDVSALNYFPMLKVLDLSDNKIHSFTGTMSPSTVNYLNVSGNRMADLKPHFFHHFGELRTLDLSNNGIYSLVSPSLFAKGRSLQHLNVSHNKINKILPEVFRGLRLNGTLNLGHNSLHHVPSAALRSAEFIAKLLLSANAFTHLDSRDLVGVRAEEIVISHQHRLKTVSSEAFANSGELRVLVLNHNPHLVFIHPEFARNLTMLRELRLDSNGLVALEEISRGKFPNLRTLDVTRNPFSCSCYNRWLYTSFDPLLNTSVTDCQHANASTSLFDSSAESMNLSVAEDAMECGAELYPMFPAHKHAFISEHASFQCSGFGNPEPEVSWSRRGSDPVSKNCSSTSTVCQRSDGKLVMKFLRVDDTGEYFCVARNPRGAATRTLSLTVDDVPVSLSATTIAARFVTLAWNGSSVLATTLLLEHADLSHRLILSHRLEVAPHLKTHSFTVQFLKPGQTYDFRLSVVSESASIPLATLRVRTREEGYTRLLGVRSDYLSVLVICVVASVASCTCILTCLIRSGKFAFRRLYFRVTGKSWDSASQRRLLNSTSTTSDVAFISISYNLPDTCFLISNEDMDDEDFPRM